MSTIACLGWGSLIWRPEKLPIELPWKEDGPRVRVEFLRKSKNGSITLVLDESAPPVSAFWAIMQLTDIAASITALGQREDIPPENQSTNIGIWRKGEVSPELIEDLPAWAQAHKVEAVIWTALRRNFFDSGEMPSAKNVVDYLQSLTEERRSDAENYVRYAPRQTDTPYRRAIAVALAWTPTHHGATEGPKSEDKTPSSASDGVSQDGDNPNGGAHRNSMAEQARTIADAHGKHSGIAEIPTFIKEVLMKARAREGADSGLLDILEKHIVCAQPPLLPVDEAFLDIDKLAESRATKGQEDGEQDHD